MQFGAEIFTGIATVEGLCVTSYEGDFHIWGNMNLWRSFIRKFSSIKVLRTEGTIGFRLALALLYDRDTAHIRFAVFPALEEMELGKDSLSTNERFELADFQPLLSARRQAGCPVKVFFRT